MTDLDIGSDSRLCFHVVEFNDKSTYVVSSSWITKTIAGTYAHWPEGVSKLQLTKLLRTHQSPKDTWVLHRIRILHTTDDADEAFDLLPVAEDTSNLEYDHEYQKKTRKARKRVILSDSDDDDEPDIVRGKKRASQCHVKVPPPPTLPPQLLTTHSSTTRSLAAAVPTQRSSGDARAIPSQPQRPSTARCTQGPSTNHDPLLVNSSYSGAVSQGPNRETPSLLESAFESDGPCSLHEPAGDQRSASFLRMYMEQSPCLSPSVTPFSDSQNESTGSPSPYVLQKLHQAILGLEARFLAFQMKAFEHDKEILVILKELRRQHSQKLLALQLPEGCPELPASSFDQLEQLNSFLADRENMSKTVQFFGLRGGSDAKDVIRQILRCLLKDSLAIGCSWNGSRGEKHAFSKLENVRNLILASARDHFNTITDAVVKSTVKSWLTWASDRGGGRTERRKKQQAAEV